MKRPDPNSATQLLSYADVQLCQECSGVSLLVGRYARQLTGPSTAGTTEQGQGDSAGVVLHRTDQSTWLQSAVNAGSHAVEKHVLCRAMHTVCMSSVVPFLLHSMCSVSQHNVQSHSMLCSVQLHICAAVTSAHCAIKPANRCQVLITLWRGKPQDCW